MYTDADVSDTSASEVHTSPTKTHKYRDWYDQFFLQTLHDTDNTIHGHFGSMQSIREAYCPSLKESQDLDKKIKKMHQSMIYQARLALQIQDPVQMMWCA